MARKAAEPDTAFSEIFQDWFHKLQSKQQREKGSYTNEKFALSIGLKKGSETVISHYMRGTVIPVVRLEKIMQNHPDFPIVAYIEAVLSGSSALVSERLRASYALMYVTLDSLGYHIDREQSHVGRKIEELQAEYGFVPGITEDGLRAFFEEELQADRAEAERFPPSSPEDNVRRFEEAIARHAGKG